MKRSENRCRLRIARETLRTISGPHLDAVAGGAPATKYCCAQDPQPKSNAWTGETGTEIYCTV